MPDTPEEYAMVASELAERLGAGSHGGIKFLILSILVDDLSLGWGWTERLAAVPNTYIGSSLEVVRQFSKSTQFQSVAAVRAIKSPQDAWQAAVADIGAALRDLRNHADLAGDASLQRLATTLLTILNELPSTLPADNVDRSHEEALASAHPKSRSLLDHAILWSIDKAWSPHGSDLGDDVFRLLQEWFARYEGRQTEDHRAFLAWCAQELGVDTQDPDERDTMLLAAAFGWIKVKGECPEALRKAALRYVNRMLKSSPGRIMKRDFNVMRTVLMALA